MKRAAAAEDNPTAAKRGKTEASGSAEGASKAQPPPAMLTVVEFAKVEAVEEGDEPCLTSPSHFHSIRFYRLPDETLKQPCACGSGGCLGDLLDSRHHRLLLPPPPAAAEQDKDDEEEEEDEEKPANVPDLCLMRWLASPEADGFRIPAAGSHIGPFAAVYTVFVLHGTYRDNQLAGDPVWQDHKQLIGPLSKTLPAIGDVAVTVLCEPFENGYGEDAPRSGARSFWIPADYVCLHQDFKKRNGTDGSCDLLSSQYDKASKAQALAKNEFEYRRNLHRYDAAEKSARDAYQAAIKACAEAKATKVEKEAAFARFEKLSVDEPTLEALLLVHGRLFLTESDGDECLDCGSDADGDCLNKHVHDAANLIEGRFVQTEIDLRCKRPPHCAARYRPVRNVVASFVVLQPARCWKSKSFDRYIID